MCLPLLAVVGSVVSGIGAAVGAMQTAASYQAQAEFHKRQAEMERDKGAFEASRAQEDANRTLGQQVANYSASGLQISGAPASVIDDTARSAALDIGAIRYGAKIRSSNEMFESRMAKMNASNAQTGAIFGFLSPVISGATKMASAY